jgi:glycosyltransferase involved in cell wall biosynthesis
MVCQLVSVITPCLNASVTIDATLDSVVMLADKLATQGDTLEHWIIDGGSNDSTVEIVRQHAGGLYGAMNVGLRHARGHFSHILNADDIILDPQEYAQFLRNGRNQQAAVLLTSILYFRRPCYRFTRSWNVRPLPKDRHSWHSQLRSGLHYPHPGFIAETELYKREGFDERYSLSADYKLMQSLLLCPELATRVNVCESHLVGMAEGGATAGFGAVLRGSRQLAAINRELGICDPFWSRYMRKLWGRLKPFEPPVIAVNRVDTPVSTP